LLEAGGTVVETADVEGLDAALHSAGLAPSAGDGDRRFVDAEPEVVAYAAMTGGVVLRRIAPAEDAGLERLFFELTAARAGTHTPRTNPIDAELAGATA
jgi:hypothetical protein